MTDSTMMSGQEWKDEATVITFLTKLNGKRALFLEIDYSLLDNTGPEDTKREKVRKGKNEKNWEIMTERKVRESWVVKGV